MPVLVIGGTRGTGLLVARRLEHQGVAVRLLARDPVRACDRLGSAFEVIGGDITRPETIPDAMAGASHVVFTAGCRSGRPATERHIRETEYDGVVNTLTAARGAGFSGRFVYMTSSGVASRSWMAALLNLYKGNTLHWRLRAEDAIRGSAVDYTIVRAGVLVNRPGGERAVRVTQEALPLSPRYRIARADVADALVAALTHPRARRATFEVVWSAGRRLESWAALLAHLEPDEGASTRVTAR